MAATAADADTRWFTWFGPRRPGAEIRLLCFHHAGGSASAYRDWPTLLPHRVEPVAVQLPGRAGRFGEPPFDRMEPLVAELVDAVRPLLDRPFACYGASMGARVAWSLVQAARERSLPGPTRLFVACDPAPVHDDGQWPWEGHPGGLEGYLREMGGTPAEVLAEPELVRALLPTLRADLAVLSSHDAGRREPLDVPIHGFAGTDDDTAPPDLMAAWARETSARFDLTIVRGGHFFTADAELTVVSTISEDLARRG